MTERVEREIKDKNREKEKTEEARKEMEQQKSKMLEKKMKMKGLKSRIEECNRLITQVDLTSKKWKSTGCRSIWKTRTRTGDLTK